MPGFPECFSETRESLGHLYLLYVGHHDDEILVQFAKRSRTLGQHFSIPALQHISALSLGSDRDGGFAGGEDIEVVLEACDGEDTFDGLGGGGEAEGDPLLAQGVLGAHEGREGCRVHERDVAEVDDDRAYALVLDGPLYSVLEPRGGMEVHLTPDRDYGVSLGMLGYADLEVRACSLPSRVDAERPMDLNSSSVSGKPPTLYGHAMFSANIPAYGRERYRAGGRLRRRGESLPLDQELLQRHPRLCQATLCGGRGQEAPQGYFLHRREAGGRGGTGDLGALVRLQPQQVRLQGALQAARGARDPDPGRGKNGFAQGRLGHRRRRRHDAPRGARRHLRPRLGRRGLRRGRRVPPEREGHPRRDHKRGPVHLPGPPRRLRRPHGPGRYT